jgi:hypothetical protein
MATTTPAGVEVTPKMLADAYIAKSIDQPGKSAVFQWVANGRHPVIADGFDTGEQANAWIKFHSVGGASSV